MPHVFSSFPGTKREGRRESHVVGGAQGLGEQLNHDCGGNASCTTCRVEVQTGGNNLSEDRL